MNLMVYNNSEGFRKPLGFLFMPEFNLMAGILQKTRANFFGVKMLNCEQCGLKIKQFNCWIRRRKHHFCSKKCNYTWRKGKSFVKKSENCARCGQEKYRTINNTWYCKKHIRWYDMRCGARLKGKYAPSFEELDILLKQTNGMFCIGCNQKMKWTRKEGGLKVMSLQHDRSGRIVFICLGCNIRHRFYKGDSFYNRHKHQKEGECEK